MSERDLTEGWPASYFMPSVSGLLAGIAVAVVLIIAMAAVSLPMDWSMLGLLPVILVVVGLGGVLLGLPIAALFGAIMAVAERATPAARTLPAWLLGGIVAVTPLMGFVLYTQQGPGNAQAPVSAAIAPFIVIYAAGLTAAFAAWRMRYGSDTL